MLGRLRRPARGGKEVVAAVESALWSWWKLRKMRLSDKQIANQLSSVNNSNVTKPEPDPGNRLTRRERFRAYMVNVDPATNPLTAIERGYYVKPPGAIANQIVGRFEIEPAARQLIVGGIGSGKTTQLLVSTNSLNEISDVVATYIDVSTRQDLGQVKPGCLVALASAELLIHTEGIDSGISLRVSSWLRGYTDGYADQGRYDGEWVPGILATPEPDWSNIDQWHVDDLNTLANASISGGKHPVFLFDSMDRMSDHVAFSRVVEEDIAALHACGVGVVLVGPLRSLEGFGRIDVDRFDHLHVQAPIDVRSDEFGRNFLEIVLNRRATEEMLPEDARAELVLWSGGVLRDLMSLAKLAGEEAYLDGADGISVDHVRRAADRFGRSLLMGLQPDELDKLKQVQVSGRFVQVSPSDIALIVTRRVLEYRERTGSYAVHPAIAPLLADVGSAA
jgi:hypothetical protein